MSFTSTKFIVFFILLFIIHYRVPYKWQSKVLLLGSIIFYYSAGWYCLIYICTTTVTTFIAANKIGDLAEKQEKYFFENRDKISKEDKKTFKLETKKEQKKWFVACLLLNFGILAIVKYTGFVINNINGILKIFNYEYKLNFVNLALPMGISFYTFQSMGYLIDIYWNKYKPQRDLCKFALFVTWFPQLIQGPISRYTDLGKSLYAEHHWNNKEIAKGIERVIWGFAKKLIIADRLAIPLKTLIGNTEKYTGVYVIAVMFIYAIQLYADFTGGIDITIGVSQMLGVKVAENFERPFFSKNTAEYWRRWHISMGTWFKDYVFYPLSVSKWMLNINKKARLKLGNNIGKKVSVYLSTIILWFVTGIWHGASWNFIVWGLLNGIVIIISQECEPLYNKFHSKFPKLKESFRYGIFEMLRTFILMSMIRVLDVYRNVTLTFKQIGSIVTNFNPWIILDGSFLNLGIKTYDWIIVAIGIIVMTICSILGTTKSVRDRLAECNQNIAWCGSMVLIVLIIIFGVYGFGYDSTQFIYNQF